MAGSYRRTLGHLSPGDSPLSYGRANRIVEVLYRAVTRTLSSSNQFTTVSMCKSALLGRSSARKCLPSGATFHVVPTRSLKSSLGCQA